MPKGGALLHHYCLQYQLEQLVGDRVRRRPMALSIPGPTGRIYRLLDDHDVSGLARPDAAAARRFAGRAVLYLVAGVPKQKPMRQVFAPDLAAAKTKQGPHGRRGGLKG
jgi:hypothetical protein